MNERHDDLQEIIDAALREMAAEEGEGFDPQACNLAEFCRRTGLTRSRARTVRAHGFRALPHGNSGRRAAPGVLAGHTGLVDDLLRKGVTNSQVIFERLLGQGYAGGLTTVKTYIAAHRDLVPAKRRQAAPQGCRGRRFRTEPGEAYQMDWGFAAVERPGGERARIACFAMVCHHCGSAHVDCLIVDEVGRCVYDRPCTDLFFDVVDRRYEKEGPNAMVLTSNIAPSGWDEFFTGDDTLLCALDRLFDKASVFVMRGPSYRGRGLDTYSVEAVPQAVKVRGIQPEGM